MALTCSILYTPSVSQIKTNIDNLKYICRDNKIHIRFKDYNKKQVIKGVEAKLTYLITYLMNYWYLPQVIQSYDSTKLIKNFLETKLMKEMILKLRLFLNSDTLKGFKLSKNYKRGESKDFGDISLSCFPSHNKKEDIEKIGGLSLFLDYFNIPDFITYIFDDGIILIIHEEIKEDITKFDRKILKKWNKVNVDSKYKELDLWE